MPSRHIKSLIIFIIFIFSRYAIAFTYSYDPEWQRLGFSEPSAAIWQANGFKSAQEAYAWNSIGVSSEDAKKQLIYYGITANEFAQWSDYLKKAIQKQPSLSKILNYDNVFSLRREGFTPPEVISWLEINMYNTEEIIKLRNMKLSPEEAKTNGRQKLLEAKEKHEKEVNNNSEAGIINGMIIVGALTSLIPFLSAKSKFGSIMYSFLLGGFFGYLMAWLIQVVNYDDYMVIINFAGMLAGSVFGGYILYKLKTKTETCPGCGKQFTYEEVSRKLASRRREVRRDASRAGSRGKLTKYHMTIENYNVTYECNNCGRSFIAKETESYES